MVTEEIGLNKILEKNHIEVNETDLGEYIIQLAGEAPSHIIAPAIHKTRKEVAKLFTKELGIPYCEGPPVLTQAARKALRKKFLKADMGLSGCNLACAETGHITTVSNEGNIRMSTTMPKIHMVFMGMERIVAKLSDTDFEGPIESGLMKMMAIGLGKHKGCFEVHKQTVNFGYSHVIPKIGSIIFDRIPVLFGVGIVENIYDETACIKACLPDQFYETESISPMPLKKRWGRKKTLCWWKKSTHYYLIQTAN